MIKTSLVALSLCFGLAGAAQAGCITGAIAGGVVGHMAGHHGMAGAAVGCAVGHHHASKVKRDDAQRSQSNNSDASH